MPYENSQASVQAPSLTARPTSPGVASTWRHLPVIAKCIIIVPLTLALLGAEIELRLCPQLDVLITAAGVWGVWAWLNGIMPPTK